MSITIIAGGSSGIGQAAAIRTAERGSGAIVTYNKNLDGAEQTVERIQQAGGRAVALPLDIGRSETFPGFRESVQAALAETWGARTITGLVNNAGFGQMSMFEDTTEELLDRFYDVPSGLEAGYSAYASMKGGLIVLTRYLAKELSNDASA